MPQEARSLNHRDDADRSQRSDSSETTRLPSFCAAQLGAARGGRQRLDARRRARGVFVLSCCFWLELKVKTTSQCFISFTVSTATMNEVDDLR